MSTLVFLAGGNFEHRTSTSEVRTSCKTKCRLNRRSLLLAHSHVPLRHRESVLEYQTTAQQWLDDVGTVQAAPHSKGHDDDKTYTMIHSRTNDGRFARRSTFVYKSDDKPLHARPCTRSKTTPFGPTTERTRAQLVLYHGRKIVMRHTYSTSSRLSCGN